MKQPLQIFTLDSIFLKSKYLFFFFIDIFMPDNTLYEFNPTTLVENKITLSEITDDITNIPPDNSFPTGMIYKYELTYNSINLSVKDTGILTFDRNGKFLRKIENIGRGPGEYTKKRIDKDKRVSCYGTTILAYNLLFKLLTLNH